MKHSFAIIIFLLLLIRDLWNNDFQDGLNVWVKGDHETALLLFKPIAEQGDGVGSRHLGNTYPLGEWC
jgi:hypothetical protein